ncbi:MAG: hypothetical protein AB7S50_02035 [Bacteroidales bacterium]
MKKNFFKRIFNLTWLVLAALLTFTACDDDDDDSPDVIILDGLYIMGDATALDTYNTDGRFAVTKNEVIQEDRASLYEKYIAISATGTFKIMKVTGALKTQYGPGTDFAVVGAADRDNEEPQVDFWRGSYTENTTEFSVPADGLYHVVIDTELGKIAIIPVNWGLIGAATPGGWTDDTELPQGTFSKESITFSKTNVEMRQNEFKYRYSGGWKVILDTVVDLGSGKKGVKVNTNFGGAINELVPGGSNINFTAPGIYTMNVSWTLSDGTTASATKTGDLSFTDWSDVVFDVFGTGVDPTGTGAVVDASTWAWGYAVSANSTPTIEGDVATGAKFTYNWTNVSLVNADGEGFALRSVDGTNYNGTVLRYSVLDTTRSNMSVVDKTTNSFGDVNINVTTDGGYDVVLTIDAASYDKASVIIVKTGDPTYNVWSLIGSATPGGWTDTEMTPNLDGTEWTWTGELVEGEFKFRANGAWDYQIGDDGAGGAEFSNNATAWAIAAGDVGNYTIVLDSDTPDITITKN